MKLVELFDRLFPKLQETSIPKRVYFYATLNTAMFYTITFIVKGLFFAGASPWTQLVIGSLAVLGFVMHILCRLGKSYPTFFLLGLILLIIPFNFLNGGTDGPVPFIIYTSYVLIFAVLPDTPNRTKIMGLAIAISIAIAVVPLINPSIVVPYTNHNVRMFDYILVYFSGFFLLGNLFMEVYAAVHLRSVEHETKIDQLEKSNNIDKMTKCFNKAYLQRKVADFIAMTTEDGGRPPFAIIMTDIDHFKKVNDTHGHPVGDECIKEVANIIRGNTPRSNVVARYGGEEFVIFMPFTNRFEASAHAEMLRMRISANALTSQRLRITMSFGVAILNEFDTAESIVDRSDKNLYKSKQAGRNRVTG
jgi:diguanylate cyclase (GGDEF)-like protein